MARNIVIIGGKLQGIEAAYLCREAGIDITLIDMNPKAPAQGLCTEFICADVLSDDIRVANALKKADMILPTMETLDVLEGLADLCEEKGYTLAFDMAAYRITMSKKASDRLFVDNGLPCPQYYPGGSLPYFAKPEAESGSHGVKKFENTEEGAAAFAEFIKDARQEYIIQEYVSGPSYSVEIIGQPGEYRVYELTEIFIDSSYDCRLAAAYRTIEDDKKDAINNYALKIAEALELKGIMDLEVIATDRGDGPDGLGIKILEIDARLPSQTSVAVYHATGMNYIEELYDLFVHGNFKKAYKDKGGYASYCQYLVTEQGAEQLGEHIVVEGDLLEFENISRGINFMSDRRSGKNQWRGVFVCWADSRETLAAREEALEKYLVER